MAIIISGVSFTDEEKKQFSSRTHTTCRTNSDDNSPDDELPTDSKIECDPDIDGDSESDYDFNNMPAWITKTKNVDGKMIPIKRQIISDDDPDDTIYFQCLGRGGRMCKTHNKKATISIIKDKNNHFLCEFSPGPVRAFVDYDQKGGIDMAGKETQQQILTLLLELFAHGMEALGHPIPNNDVLKITDSGGKVGDETFKTSFHVVADMLECFSSSVQAAQLMDKMKEYAATGKKYEEVSKHIDGSVYSTDRPMRIIGHEKYDRDPKTGFMTIPTGRVMKAIDKDFNYLNVPDNELLNYLMSYKNGEYELINDDEKYVKTQNKKCKESNTSRKGNKQCQPDMEKNKQLTDLVRAKYPSANLVRVSQCPNGIVYYDFDYTRGKDCCPNGLKSHENLTFYCWVHNNIVYAKCRSDTCKRKKAITIGKLQPNEKEIKEQENRRKLFDLCKVETIDEEYLSPITKRHVFTLLTDTETKNVCIQSQCGTGKTKMHQEVLPRYIMNFRRTKFKDPRILIISTRIAYLDDLKLNTLKAIEDKTSYIFHNYRGFEDKTELKEKDGLIISLESLHHICLNEGGEMLPYDLVILDESESIFQQIFSSTIKRDKVINFNDFQEVILKYAHKTLILDAGLSDSTLDMINIDDCLTKTVIVRNTRLKASNKKIINVTNDKEAFIEKIKTKLDQNENIIIVLCRREPELIEWLKSYFEVDKDENEYFCSYTSDTGDIKRNELKNININWSKYRVILYTSTVGAGLNYSCSLQDFIDAGIQNATDDYVHFDSIFVIAEHNTIVQEIVFQMIHRVRKIKTNIVDVLIPNIMNFDHDLCIADMDDGIKQLKNVKNVNLKLVTSFNAERGTIVRETVLNTYDHLHARYLRDQMNTSAKLWLSTFKLLATQKGHEISFDFVFVKNKKGETVKKPQTKLNDVTRRGLIVEADNIKTFHTKEELAQQKMENAKSVIINSLGISKATDKMKDSIVDCFMVIKNCIENIIKYHIGSKNNYEHDTYIDKIFSARKQIYDICRKAFGFNESQIITLDHETFIEILDKFVFPQDMLNVLRKNDDVKFYKNIDILKSVLNSFGFVLTNDKKQKRVDGVRQYVTTTYTIEPKTEVYELIRLMLIQKLSSNKVIKDAIKSNDEVDRNELLTTEHRKSIETFNNLLRESDKYEKYVKYISLVNEILKHHTNKCINDKQKESLITFLDDVKEYSSIDELFDQHNIKPKIGVFKSKIVRVKKLV